MQEILLRLPETPLISVAVCFFLLMLVINFIAAVVFEVISAVNSRMWSSPMSGPARRGWSLLSPVCLAVIAMISGLLTNKHSVE